MNPTLSMSMHNGVPLANCHDCKAPARARMLAVEWTGETFDVRATFECHDNTRHVNTMRLQGDGRTWQKVVVQDGGWVEVPA